MKDSPNQAESRTNEDSVIEAYKKDIDCTLIRENLRLTVDQRFQQLMKLQRFAEQLQNAARKARQLQGLTTSTHSFKSELFPMADRQQNGTGAIDSRMRFADLPPEVEDRSAWYGPEMAKCGDWIERLSDFEIAEVEQAVRGLEGERIDLTSITAREVPLPTLEPRLQQILDEVLNGRGFVLLRALPLDLLTRREAALAFLAIGVHLGNLRMQNAEGHLLGHVKDLGRSSDDPNTRIYQTRERQTHHTDSCDVVGLLCLQTAKSGGLSSLVSSTTIFNEMRRRRPDLLRVLLEPIETDRRGEVPEGSKPYFTIPVFNYHNGLVSAIYQRQYIESARRFPGVMPLTPLQIEALDLFDNLANDPKLNLMMELQPGDIQLVQNHTILHDRTAFEDYPEPERKRHLLRLWLAPPGARALPEVYAERFGSITPGFRGGVAITGVKGKIPFE